MRLHLHDLWTARWRAFGLGLLLGVFPNTGLAQDASASSQALRIITADAYERWQTLDGALAQLSPDGQWAAYKISSSRHSEVVVRHTRRATEYRIPGADYPRFSADGRYVACVVTSNAEVLHQGAARGAAAPTLRILTLATGRVEVIPGVSEVMVVPGNGALLLYRTSREAPASSQDSATGAPLVVRALDTKQERRFDDVTSYTVDPTGTWLVYVVASSDPARSGVHLYALRQSRTTSLVAGPGPYTSFTFDEAGGQLAFLGPAAAPMPYAHADTPSHALYYARLDQRAVARRVVTPAALGDTLQVAAEGTVAFSRTGNAVLFGVEPLPSTPATPHQAAADSAGAVLANVELWDSRAPHLPWQLRGSPEQRWSTAIYWPARDQWVRLGTDARPDVTVNDDARVGVALTYAPYAVAGTWGALQYDVYAVNTRTGRHTLVRRQTGAPAALATRPPRVILASATWSVRVSPGGRYLLFYEQDRWWSHDLTTGQVVDLTGELDIPDFKRFDRRLPAEVVGWLPDDARVLLSDQIDIWSVDPRGGAPARNLTADAGRHDTLKFRVVGSRHIAGGSYLDPMQPLLLRAENLTTWETGFWRLRLNTTAPPTRLTMVPARLELVSATPDDKAYLLTRETYRDFPDLWFTDRLEAPAYNRLTHAQPQQAQYRWGAAELVRYTRTRGDTLAGVLYKPEDFDSARKYPLVVSIYERQAWMLHQYEAPKPNNAVITPVNYVSKGYLVLRPDITYTIGQPCESAVASVVGAVQSLIARGIVDSTRIGLTGASFGGYETMCILTRTPMFRAAIATLGPVNLVAGYGHYLQNGWSGAWRSESETGQGRMGTTPWESPSVYVENSPIFHAQHIQTPLLLMYGDADDNVPLSQGLELFTAMRRLGKEAYLFNYLEEGHGLRQRANQLDWDRRTQAFFDHYLMDSPRPSWMADAPRPHASAAR